jgi:DNA-directed RNA polymerase beta' subunit
LFDTHKIYHITAKYQKHTLSQRRLEGKKIDENFDPLLDTPQRKVYFEEGEKEEKDLAEKVKDKFVEAGNDTRNTNQYVKFINAHIQNKVSTLERIKEAQRKFEQEVDMFKADPEIQQDKAEVNQTNNVENTLIIRELSSMINKYGIEKISNALDQLFAKR